LTGSVLAVNRALQSLTLTLGKQRGRAVVTVFASSGRVVAQSRIAIR
jgi:hypothetical protein